MKDEIPQSVIDSHVKNAAKARAEKAKKENSEESKGRVKNECEWNKQAAFKFVNQKLVCEQAPLGRSSDGAWKGRRPCNYVSGIWIPPPNPLWLLVDERECKQTLKNTCQE